MIPRSLNEPTMGTTLLFKRAGDLMTLTFSRERLTFTCHYYIPFYTRRANQKSDQYPILNQALSRETLIYCRLQINSRKSCQFCREDHWRKRWKEAAQGGYLEVLGYHCPPFGRRLVVVVLTVLVVVEESLSVTKASNLNSNPGNCYPEKFSWISQTKLAVFADVLEHLSFEKEDVSGIQFALRGSIETFCR